jgi:hypothetical protein
MSDVISKTVSTGKELVGDSVSALTQAPSAGKNAITSKEGITTLVYAAGGVIFGGMVTKVITMIPFKMIPMVGRPLRVLTTVGMGAGLLTYGRKTSSDFGLAMIIGGGTMAVLGMGQALALTGRFDGLSNLLMSAEDGYIGNMTLNGYEAIDSVEVDRSSYQPTQDYGAETNEQIATAGTPQVQIASRQESDPLDSVREEAAMGHGVTQWFGSEHSSSASPLFRKAPSMKAFKASTDVGGNRTTTGDDSMANVIGGASMADSPATTTNAYDVSLEMNMTPTPTKEVGGIQDAFDTYILPSYEMPSAGGSGRGVTQWYAESKQTGYIGNFMAGAEGHGSVLGQ